MTDTTYMYKVPFPDNLLQLITNMWIVKIYKRKRMSWKSRISYYYSIQLLWNCCETLAINSVFQNEPWIDNVNAHLILFYTPVHQYMPMHYISQQNTIPLYVTYYTYESIKIRNNLVLSTMSERLLFVI